MTDRKKAASTPQPVYIRVALVVNTQSRKGKAAYKQVAQLLRERGITPSIEQAVTHPKYLGDTLTAVLAEKPDLLIIGGGDGTVRTAAARVAHSSTVLGYIPLGTTNNFARDLAIPTDIPAAVDIIARGRVAKIDLGQINGVYFANVSSMGISVAIAQSVSGSLKQHFGRFAYAFEGLRALLTHQAMAVTVTTPAGSKQFYSHEVVIANGRFHGGILIADDIRIDDHSFVIFHLGDTSRWQLLRSLVLFALRQRRSLHEGNFIVASKATINTYPPQPLELDGEIKAHTPVRVSIARNALQVIVPADFIG